jgi:hypothetical protein
MSDFVIKQGDRLPKLRQVLTDGANAPLDLTGVTGVAFRLRPQNGGALVTLTGSAAVVAPATSGIVEYSWGPGDTATRGDFFGEWVLTYAGPVTRTVPAPGYVTVEVAPVLP